MRLSVPARVMFGVALIVALVAYATVVDLGSNAGKVLRGVDVQGYDIGGLTFEQAETALDEQGSLLQAAPMVFTTEGFDCRFTPGMIGWGPQPRDTALSAMGVGREGGVANEISARLRSWLGRGTSIEWAGKPDPARMGRELTRCQRSAEAVGLTIDLAKLRFLVKREIVTWPRTEVGVPIPLAEG